MSDNDYVPRPVHWTRTPENVCKDRDMGASASSDSTRVTCVACRANIPRSEDNADVRIDPAAPTPDQRLHNLIGVVARTNSRLDRIEARLALALNSSYGKHDERAIRIQKAIAEALEWTESSFQARSAPALDDEWKELESRLSAARANSPAFDCKDPGFVKDPIHLATLPLHAMGRGMFPGVLADAQRSTVEKVRQSMKAKHDRFMASVRPLGDEPVSGSLHGRHPNPEASPIRVSRIDSIPGGGVKVTVVNESDAPAPAHVVLQGLDSDMKAAFDPNVDPRGARFVGKNAEPARAPAVFRLFNTNSAYPQELVDQVRKESMSDGTKPKPDAANDAVYNAHVAVQAFQRAAGIRADGIVGPETVAAVHRILGTVPGGSVAPHLSDTDVARIGANAMYGKTIGASGKVQWDEKQVSPLSPLKSPEWKPPLWEQSRDRAHAQPVSQYGGHARPHASVSQAEHDGVIGDIDRRLLALETKVPNALAIDVRMIERLSENISNYEDRLHSLEARLLDVGREAASSTSVDTRFTTANRRIADLEKQLKNGEVDTQATARLATLEASHSALASSLCTLEGLVRALDVDQLNGTIASLVKRCEIVERSNAALLAQVRNLDAAYKALSERVHETDAANIADHETKLQNHDKEIERVVNVGANLEENLRLYEQRLQKLEAFRAGLARQMLNIDGPLPNSAPITGRSPTPAGLVPIPPDRCPYCYGADGSWRANCAYCVHGKRLLGAPTGPTGGSLWAHVPEGRCGACYRSDGSWLAECIHCNGTGKR